MEPVQQLSVQELKDLAGAVAKIGTGIGKVLEDGKVDWRDTVHVPAILSGIRELSEVSFQALLPELKDMDDAEREDLAAHFRGAFELPNDSTEAVIEQGLELVLMGLQAVLAFTKIGQAVKVAA